MLLVFQIALGVLIGGGLLHWWKRRSDRQEALASAYQKGREIGAGLSAAIELQAQTTLAGLQERLLDVMTTRIERLAPADGSIEQQQATNRGELARLMEATEPAESIVRDHVNRYQAEWLAVADELGSREQVDGIIRHQVALWKANLLHSSSTAIIEGRRRASEGKEGRDEAPIMDGPPT